MIPIYNMYASNTNSTDEFPPPPELVATIREQVLNQARDIVTKDRQADHGRPEDTFVGIADLWQAYLFHRPNADTALTACDVASMMVLLKIARAQQNPTHKDNWVDMAGYAACGAELAGT